MQPGEKPIPKAIVRGWTAMGVFLFFGAGMACFAGTTLIWRGTELDRAWALNATAHRELTQFGTWIGLPFLLLSLALLAAGIGWFRRRKWGWALTVGIMAMQAAGDLVNVIRGDVLKGAIGVTVAALLLVWLTWPGVRSAFRTEQ